MTARTCNHPAHPPLVFRDGETTSDEQLLAHVEVEHPEHLQEAKASIERNVCDCCGGPAR